LAAVYYTNSCPSDYQLCGYNACFDMAGWCTMWFYHSTVVAGV